MGSSIKPVMGTCDLCGDGKVQRLAAKRTSFGGVQGLCLKHRNEVKRALLKDIERVTGRKPIQRKPTKRTPIKQQSDSAAAKANRNAYNKFMNEMVAWFKALQENDELVCAYCLQKIHERISRWNVSHTLPHGNYKPLMCDRDNIDPAHRACHDVWGTGGAEQKHAMPGYSIVRSRIEDVLYPRYNQLRKQ